MLRNKLNALVVAASLCCVCNEVFANHVRQFSVASQSERILADKDLETIRTRIINDLLQPAVKKEMITELITSFSSDGTWPGINYKDTSRTGFEHRIHLENMLSLARAVRKTGSPFYKDSKAKQTLSDALNFWLKHDFRCENWWWNEMGTPQWMINILLMMDEDLNEYQRAAGLKIAGRANLEAFGARPGGDLLPIAGMLGKQALFTRDTDVLELVIEVMASEIQVTTGRGIKPDLSFHHRTDNVISTLTYGSSFASSFAYWGVKIAGTRFKFPEPALRLLIDYYIDGISRSMVHGIYPDPGAENRDMTRMNALRREGTDLPENLLKISNYRYKELQHIINLRNGKALPSSNTNKFFWHSSYLVHDRPTWFASVRMHSSRSSNMEQPHNDEGIRMHHFGDGANFISRRGTEYYNIYPVWNWQMIPGTTVMQKDSLPHWKELAKKGKSSFSGGASDGRYGLAAIDLVSVHDPLRAKKAWFLFDNEYVCLGTDITAEKDLPVFTTINQTLLMTPVVAKSNGKQTVLATGDHKLNNVSWIIHDSVAYVFPEPADINLFNRETTGSWRNINHQSWATDDPVKEDVFSLWIDHGRKPAMSGYAYMVVPATSLEALDRYTAKSGIRIIANNPELQAVMNTSAGIAQMVFYTRGEAKLFNSSITAEQPCLVMLSAKGNTLSSVTLSDPTQTLKTLRVYLKGKVVTRTPGFKTTWHEDSGRTLLEADLPQEGFAGQSVTATF